MSRPTPEAPDFDKLLEDVAEENDLDKILNTFLDPAHIRHLTDLNAEEIQAFTTLSNFAKEYKLEPLAAWLAENLQLRVSKSRAGRREFTKIAQRTPEYPQEHQRRFWDFRER